MTTGIARGLGGMAANVACAAIACNEATTITVKLLAPCGQDGEGDWLRQQLTQQGIGIEWLDYSAKTHYCLVLVQTDGRRMIVSEPTRLDISQLSAITRHFFDYPGPRLLYIDGFHAERSMSYARAARQQGWHTALDMDELNSELLTQDGFLQLGHAFEFLFLNQTCASQLAQSNQRQAWLDLLESLCNATGSTVLLTLGEQGALLFCPHQSALPIPTIAVKTVDTTGAGDIFAGVFLACWGNGLSALDAAQRACIAASLSTTGHGAIGYLPSTEAIATALDTL